MACKTETKTIGEHDYSVTQWNATKAIITKMKLIKCFGPAMGSLVVENSNDIDIGNAFAKLFSNYNPEEMVELFKECIIGVSCDGTFITGSKFEELYSGDNLLDAYKVFMFVVKTNYASLMKSKGVGRLLSKLKPMTAE